MKWLVNLWKKATLRDELFRPPVEPYRPFDSDGYPLAFGKRLYSGEQGRLTPEQRRIWNEGR